LSVCPAEGAILDEWKPELQRNSEILNGEAVSLDDKRHLDAEVLLLSGMNRCKNGEYDAAIERYTLAMKLTTRYADLFPSFRGDAYKAKGDYDRALADYSKSIELNPTQVRAHMERADLYERIGKRARAIADFQKALSHNRDMLPQYIKECEDALRRLGTMH
jgi:tetratricopeptide (TPR) repeat protein